MFDEMKEMLRYDGVGRAEAYMSWYTYTIYVQFYNVRWWQFCRKKRIRQAMAEIRNIEWGYPLVFRMGNHKRGWKRL